MADFKFNAFRIKRQAHAVSRSDASFNPFGPIWNNNDRRQTWDGEAQTHINIDDDDVETGSPIEHAQTSKDSRAGHASPDQDREREREKPDSSGDTVSASQAPGSEFTAVDTRAQMRNRARLERQTAVSPDTEPADEPKKKKKHQFFKNVKPKTPFTVRNQVRRVFGVSWLNLLLLCVPVGISLGATIGPSLETFFVNYAAVIPLYWLGDFAMTEIGLRTGSLVSNYIGISTR